MKTPLLARVQFVIKLIGLAVVLGYCVATGQQEIREHWFLGKDCWRLAYDDVAATA
jgi:hypothetical protein